MKKPLFLPLLAGLFFLLFGCLPPGDPPQGQIVDNLKNSPENDPPLTFADAREKALNDLIPAFMLFCPGEKIFPEGDAGTARVIRILAKESAAFSRSKIVSSPLPTAFLLRSSLREKIWTISLFSPQGKLLWEKRYPLCSDAADRVESPLPAYPQSR